MIQHDKSSLYDRLHDPTVVELLAGFTDHYLVAVAMSAGVLQYWHTDNCEEFTLCWLLCEMDYKI